MYRKPYKKLFSMFVCVAILVSCVIPTAFVLQSSAATPRISSTTNNFIEINGREYPCTFSVEGTLSSGGRSVFHTNARCIRQHRAVSVTFYTAGTGQETYSGGATRYNGIYDAEWDIYLGAVGTTYSYYVRYTGYDTATAIKSVNGSIRVTTVNQDRSTQSFEFSL